MTEVQSTSASSQTGGRDSTFLTRHSHLATALLVSITLVPLFASAAEFCDIRKTADGFIALRAKPESGSQMVARMKPGDEVMINSAIAAKNGWTRVYWWKGGRANGQVVKGLDRANGQGWVNSKLLGDECG